VTISTYATGNNPTRQNVINYTYDGLNRLTAADYESGTYYHYTYDAVGNRLNETRKQNSTLPEVVNTYDYDNANRLTKVNEINYSWDANGNLLNDGTNTYTYDSANRLTHLVNTTDDISYAYNGQGDRISKTSVGQTTRYTLDLNSGLTQVLADGTNTYLYGVNRISQENAEGVDYFLGDALGSVRQLVSGTTPDAKVMLTREYSPYGEIVSQNGTGKTEYGFTGELQDGGLVHLRARGYSVGMERFTSRDSWEGDTSRPQSLNKWMYVEGNPINRVDPTGHDYRNNQLLPDKRDLTNWLPRAAVYISTDPAMMEVKNLLASDVLGDNIDAYIKFNNLVKANARFDVKVKIEQALGKKIKLGENWYEYSITGNFLYGFYGVSAGFNEKILHAGAGKAQIDDLLKQIWNECDTRKYTELGGPSHFFDSYDDYHAIDFGIWSYHNYLEQYGYFTEENFIEGLDTFEYSWELNRVEDPGDYIPASKFYAPNEFDN
jgi:RHS repeat-associated protein